MAWITTKFDNAYFDSDVFDGYNGDRIDDNNKLGYESKHLKKSNRLRKAGVRWQR